MVMLLFLDQGPWLRPREEHPSRFGRRSYLQDVADSLGVAGGIVLLPMFDAVERAKGMLPNCNVRHVCSEVLHV